MSRRIAREMALQTLFQLDFAGVDRASALATVCVERGIEPGTGNAAEQYAQNLVTGVLDKLAVIDEQIEKFAIDWRVGRMAGVDRNILRIAVYEMFDVDETIRQQILDQITETQMIQDLRQRHVRSMTQDGLLKVCTGITTVSEVMTVGQ